VATVSETPRQHQNVALVILAPACTVFASLVQEPPRAERDRLLGYAERIAA
jgi:hypothetical protein